MTESRSLVLPAICLGLFASGEAKWLSGPQQIFAAFLGLSARSTVADSCGIKGAAPLESRIVNGVQASPCEWPWQARLYSYDWGFYCGGTLISDEWVLTAAHCVSDGAPFSIMLGDYNTAEYEDAQILLSVARVIMHPSYDDATFDHDFALVELATAAPLGDCIRTACLPGADDNVPYGEACHVTGWGDLFENGQVYPDILQETSVEPMENAECQSQTLYSPSFITAAMFCAEGDRNGSPTDACQGDSGGPLVCAEGGDAYTLYGVVSWGTGCASEGYPGVYAAVALVIPWIMAYLEVSLPPTPAPYIPAGSMWTVTDGACTLDKDFCIASPNYPESYPSNSECTIFVDSSLARPIQLEYFHTEYNYDVLVVNGNIYSGVAPPAGVIPEGEIIWQADGSITRKGWKLCQEAPSFDGGATWMLAGGGCEMDKNQCVTSPNFPSQYVRGPSDEGFCNIIVNPSVAVPMHVEYFETDDGRDVLYVNGEAYSGYDGPFDVVPSGTIAWSPDDRTRQARGWKICPYRPPPCDGCFSDGSVWRATGPCRVDGACVESSVYSWGFGYGLREDCYMELNPAYTEPLEVESFATENYFDFLVVNSVPYSGKGGPAGVTPRSSIITWTSDASKTGGNGWRLCAARPSTTSGDEATMPSSTPSSDLTTLPSPSTSSSPPREAQPAAGYPYGSLALTSESSARVRAPYAVALAAALRVLLC